MNFKALKDFCVIVLCLKLCLLFHRWMGGWKEGGRENLQNKREDSHDQCTFDTRVADAWFKFATCVFHLKLSFIGVLSHYL